MGLDATKLKEKFDKKAGRADRLELKDGENEIRILPPSLEYFAETVDYIGYDYLMHYNLGVEGNRQAEVCPKTLGRQHKCPVCDAVSKLYKLGTPEDKTLGGQLRAKKRHLFNVLDMNNLDKGIQILETGPKIYESLVVFVTNPKWGDLLDVDKGKNITITKTGQKESSTGYVEYSVAPDPTSTSIREKLPKNYKEAISALAKAVPVAKSYDELKAILEGEDGPVDTGKVKSSAAVSENTEETIATAPVHAEAKVTAPIVEEKKELGKEPECFGKDYGPRRPECLACSVKVTCREKFLEV